MKWVDQKRYLGVVVRSDCSNNEDTARQNQKIYSCDNVLTIYYAQYDESVRLKLYKDLLLINNTYVLHTPVE